MANFVYNGQAPIQTGSGSTVGAIGSITQNVGGLITAIDRAIHPGKYRNPPPQQGQNQSPQPSIPQPQQSGMGWPQWMLLLAAGGGAIYAGKEFLGSDKTKKSKKA